MSISVLYDDILQHKSHNLSIQQSPSSIEDSDATPAPVVFVKSQNVTLSGNGVQEIDFDVS